MSIASSILASISSISPGASTAGDTSPRQQFISQRKFLHLTTILSPAADLGKLRSAKAWCVHSVHHSRGTYYGCYWTPSTLHFPTQAPTLVDNFDSGGVFG